MSKNIDSLFKLGKNSSLKKEMSKNIKNTNVDPTKRKTIDNESQLWKLIIEEQKKPKYTPQTLRAKKSDSQTVFIDGSNVANYGTSGYPSINTILKVVNAAIENGFKRITVIVDANLRYLLIEHENIPNIDICTCLFCNATENQYIIINSKKITFLECMPHTDADETIIEMANSTGARIITNDNYAEFIDQFPFLNSKEWQIKYEISNDIVILKVN